MISLLLFIIGFGMWVVWDLNRLEAYKAKLNEKDKK